MRRKDCILLKFSKSTLHRIGWSVLITAIVLVGALGLLRENHSAEPYRKTTVAMGSVVTHTVYDSSAPNAQQAAEQASNEIAALESRISCKRADSEISALNRSNGALTAVSADTHALLQTALQVQQDTDGRYNICTRPLTLLWDFDAAEFALPNESALQAACAAVAETICTLTDQGVTLTPSGGGIDLGSVGKGAACDAAVAVYAARNCSAAIVAVGGSIGLYGRKPGSDSWLIGIRDPNSSAAAQLGTLRLSGGFISTSGTYEKTREINGVSYHHLLDPIDGMPIETDLVSATVVCSNGALSDILATACVLLGREDGCALLDMYGVQYVLIDTAQNIHVSAGLRDAFTQTADGYTIAP